MRPRGTRAFHYLAIAILTIAAIDYFSQASDLGSTPVTTEFRQPGTRAIWVSHMPIITLSALLHFYVSSQDI